MCDATTGVFQLDAEVAFNKQPDQPVNKGPLFVSFSRASASHAKPAPANNNNRDGLLGSLLFDILTGGLLGSLISEVTGLHAAIDAGDIMMADEVWRDFRPAPVRGFAAPAFHIG